jgi:glycerophosphoryl diester phosphodiesterase
MRSSQPHPMSLNLAMSLNLGLLLIIPSIGASTEPDIIPLSQAHAHNDYHHPRPLLDALSHGFCNVEADIFLVDGELLVGHDREDLTTERTLEKLYLEPLHRRYKHNEGGIFEPELPFTLLIDFKTAAEPTYRALQHRLAHYQDMLTQFNSTSVRPGAVTVIVSGNRPIELMANQAQRWAAVDGRLSDLKKLTPVSPASPSPPASLMPLISDHWPSHFKWDGRGEFPTEEKKKLLAIVQQTHAAGQRLRFWATADNRAMWQALAEAKLDLINTDNLDGLQEFLQTTQQVDR